ncbi:MAG: thioredoxin [Trebouxia sp. A1-2]|nr:MAG: thioredoxin [Trebouxia sp. A1-2]
MHPDAIKRRQDAEARWEAPGPENLILATTEIMLTDAVQQGKNAGKLVAVKFFAPWCQACKALYPKWMQLAAQNPDVTFIKVNAADDTMRAVAAAMGVTKLPYFHMYMHGQLAKNFTANLHKVSYLKRAIIDCKQCLNPGCH